MEEMRLVCIEMKMSHGSYWCSNNDDESSENHEVSIL